MGVKQASRPFAHLRTCARRALHGELGQQAEEPCMFSQTYHRQDDPLRTNIRLFKLHNPVCALCVRGATAVHTLDIRWPRPAYSIVNPCLRTNFKLPGTDAPGEPNAGSPLIPLDGSAEFVIRSQNVLPPHRSLFGILATSKPALIPACASKSARESFRNPRQCKTTYGITPGGPTSPE